MIHVDIDLESTEQNLWLKWITPFFKVTDVVLSKKLTSESPWQEKLKSSKFVFGQQNSYWPRDQLHNVTNFHHLSNRVAGASFSVIPCLDSEIWEVGGGEYTHKLLDVYWEPSWAKG